MVRVQVAVPLGALKDHDGLRLLLGVGGDRGDGRDSGGTVSRVKGWWPPLVLPATSVTVTEKM